MRKPLLRVPIAFRIHEIQQVKKINEELFFRPLCLKTFKESVVMMIAFEQLLIKTNIFPQLCFEANFFMYLSML